MSIRKQSSNLLTDLSDFIQFLKGLWGALSSISVLFPLSNAFTKVIPISQVDASIYTTIATITSIFGILYLYSSRENLLDRETGYSHNKIDPRRQYREQSLWNFFFGSICIVAYLLLYGSAPHENQSASIGISLLWLASLFLYTLVFVMVTTAFTRLALIEYMRPIPNARDILRLEDEAKELSTKNSTLMTQLERQARQIASLRQALPTTSTDSFTIFRGVDNSTVESSVIRRAIKMEIERAFSAQVLSVKIDPPHGQAHVEWGDFDRGEADMISCLVSISEEKQYDAGKSNTEIQQKIKDAVHRLGLAFDHAVVIFKRKED